MLESDWHHKYGQRSYFFSKSESVRNIKIFLSARDWSKLEGASWVLRFSKALSVFKIQKGELDHAMNY